MTVSFQFGLFRTALMTCETIVLARPNIEWRMFVGLERDSVDLLVLCE